MFRFCGDKGRLGWVSGIFLHSWGMMEKYRVLGMYFFVFWEGSNMEFKWNEGNKIYADLQIIFSCV